MYDSVFMKAVLHKAQAFYFNKFLPSIVHCVIISDGNRANSEVQLATSAAQTIPPVSVMKAAPLVSISKTIPPVFTTKTTPLVSSNSVCFWYKSCSSSSLSKVISPVSVANTIQSVSVAKTVPPVSGAKTISVAKAVPPVSVTMIAPVPLVSIHKAIIETDELEITSTTKHNTLPLRTVLNHLKSKKHSSLWR